MKAVSRLLREIKLPKKIIQTRMLGEDRLEDSLKLLYDEFFKYENVCVANDLISNPKACDEVANLAAKISEDGLSMIATEKDTGKIVASFYNKVLTPDSDFFENFKKNHCKQENSKALLNIMTEVDSQYDAFKLFNVDSYIDMVFISVAQAYAKNGIATVLIDDFLKYLISSEKSGKKMPNVVLCTVTSMYTYNIGIKLKFKEILRKGFDDFNIDSGKVDYKLHKQGLAVMAKEVSQWKLENNIE